MRVATGGISNEKVEADARMRVIAGELADLLNRAESEHRSLTLKEQGQFNAYDEELTRLLTQYGEPAFVTLS